MPLHRSAFFPFMLVIFAVSLSASAARAQTATPPSQQPNTTAAPASPTLPEAPLPQSLIPGKNVAVDQESHPLVRVRTLPLHMVQDGENIFVSPVYIRGNDLK